MDAFFWPVDFLFPVQAVVSQSPPLILAFKRLFTAKIFDEYILHHILRVRRIAAVAESQPVKNIGIPGNYLLKFIFHSFEPLFFAFCL